MKKYKNLISSFVIPIGVMFYQFLYFKILYNILVSLDDVSKSNISSVFKVLLQYIGSCLPIAVLFIVEYKRVGNDKLYIKFPSKKLWKIVLAIFTIVYLLIMIYGLYISHDIVKTIFTAVFYLLFISFMEEYTYRSIVPYLQKDHLPQIIEWLLPNILFSSAHFLMLFVDPTKANGISLAALLLFFIDTIIFGIVMELFKRRSSSLYIPILFHAAYDFFMEIMLWV